jgi:hypothetical protein
MHTPLQRSDRARAALIDKIQISAKKHSIVLPKISIALHNFDQVGNFALSVIDDLVHGPPSGPLRESRLNDTRD